MENKSENSQWPSLAISPRKLKNKERNRRKGEIGFYPVMLIKS